MMSLNRVRILYIRGLKIYQNKIKYQRQLVIYIVLVGIQRKENNFLEMRKKILVAKKICIIVGRWQELEREKINILRNIGRRRVYKLIIGQRVQ